MKAIILDNISKTYDKGRVNALTEVSLSISTGELFGLIGPDGAGKSTLFRILTTLLLPDRGTASVAGFDIIKEYHRIRNCIGYMPGKFSLYQDLTVEENLTFFATLFGTTIQQNYVLIRDIYEQIEPFRTRRAGQLSGGMKQKLALCCALIHKPTVLFLDEPTTGVDAVSRREFWEMLKGLKQQGITILVSTPYMDEANLCERIALIQDGRILSIDSPEGITGAYPEKLYAIKSGSIPRLLDDVRHYPGTASCNAFGEYLHVTFNTAHPGSLRPDIPGPDAQTEPAAIEKYLLARGHPQLEIKAIPATIEDCFIKLMSLPIHPGTTMNDKAIS